MKKTFILTLFLISTVAMAETALLLVGGGSRPVEAMKVFSELSGSEKSFIVIIPWASETTEGAVNIRRELEAYPAGKIEIASSNAAELQKQLLKASGIFFTGGDQNKLMQVMKELKLKNSLKKMYQNGVVFAGTSAGTAIMSEKMINGEGDLSVLDGKQIGISEGLGLLPSSVVVDQHFIVRSRFNRLAGVVLDSKVLGIAIDENNALLIKDGSVGKVFGPTQVLFFTPTNAKKLSIDIYEKNEVIDLKKYPAF